MLRNRLMVSVDIVDRDEREHLQAKLIDTFFNGCCDFPLGIIWALLYLVIHGSLSRMNMPLSMSGMRVQAVFCDDCRNNMLLGLKFAVMTFKSQNDCIIHYSYFVRRTHWNTSPFAKMISIGYSKI